VAVSDDARAALAQGRAAVGGKKAMPKTKAPPAPSIPPTYGFDPSPRQVHIVLQRRQGELMTAADITRALKQDPEIFDNRAAVIGITTRLEERGKIERGWVGDGPAAKTAWMVPVPKEEKIPA